MEYRAHDLPVTGLGFAPERAGVALEGFNLLAGSADYKITLLKSQGESADKCARYSNYWLGQEELSYDTSWFSVLNQFSLSPILSTYMLH